MRTLLEIPRQTGFPQWLNGLYPLHRTQNGDGVEVSADEDGEVLDEETFQQMRIAFGARILTNEPDKIAAASGLRPETQGIERAVRVSRYPKPLLPVVLIALIFGATGLHAQLVTPLASPPRLSDVVRLTQPAIM